MTPAPIAHRDHLVDLLPGNCIGCELGVFEGEFSSTLLRSNKFSELYLVDSFAGPAWNFGRHYPEASVLYEKVSQRFANDVRVRVIKGDSVAFLETSPALFDFVYIDTVHSYEHLRRELSAALGVMRKPGYICGHDYCDEFPGIARAVDEFTAAHGLRYQVTQDAPYRSFAIVLP